MFVDQPWNPPQFYGRETEVSRKCDRLQPEPGRQIVPIDMDMGRLTGFMAVEVEAVRAASQDGRHELFLRSCDGLVRPKTVDLSPLERARPVGLPDGDALAEPRHHIAGQPFEGLLLLLLFVCRLDETAPSGVFEKTRGDLRGSDKPLLLPGSRHDAQIVSPPGWGAPII